MATDYSIEDEHASKCLHDGGLLHICIECGASLNFDAGETRIGTEITTEYAWVTYGAQPGAADEHN